MLHLPFFGLTFRVGDYLPERTRRVTYQKAFIKAIDWVKSFPYDAAQTDKELEAGVSHDRLWGRFQKSPGILGNLYRSNCDRDPDQQPLS
jgi:hypothetical protein